MKPHIAQHIITDVTHTYDQIAEHFSDTRQYPWPVLAPLVRQYIQPGNQVLDVGCGNGRLADLIDEIKGDHTVNYTGVDISSQLIAQARKQHPRHSFHVANMLSLPFEDAQFNTLFAVASFPHIPSRALRIQALQEFSRVLMPGGHIIMTNWNLHQRRFIYYRLQSVWRSIFGQESLDWNDVLIPWKDAHGTVQVNRYYHAFTIRELRTLTAATDLRSISQYYERQGVRSQWWNGQNIVSILKKMKKIDFLSI